MDKERICNYIKEENLKNHFVKVFDERTILAVHKLAKKGFFKELEFMISEGKEAVVFRARNEENDYVAVKVYKIETSGFRKMQDYLHGDPRFTGITNNKRAIVYAWTKKEYRNLEVAANAGLNVPLPIGFYENCLVMEFIGKEIASKKLKEDKPEDAEKAYSEVVDFIAGFYKQGLVHADLSEYNILNDRTRIVVIDIGQAVSRAHPEAKKFFERDITNLSRYFTKIGLKKSYEELLEDVKVRKDLKSQ